MRQFVVDAFADRLFTGNPAAVCLPEQELPADVMQMIAKENNLSETAFVLPSENGQNWSLRWFTPGGEIDLCGHATLATAFVLMSATGLAGNSSSVIFDTLGGRLEVCRDGDLYMMDVPIYHLSRVEVTSEMAEALGAMPDEAYLARDLVCVFEDGAVVRNMKPDMDRLCGLDGLLVNVTAPGEGHADCVSRSFAPKLNVPEDPVCGSGHCHIVPYWSERLGKNNIVAYQASARGGTLYCHMHGDRIAIGGKAALFSVGEICI